MKIKTLILLAVSIVFSFKSITAKSDISVHNNIIATLSEIKNSKDYNFVKKYLKDENDEFKIASVYALSGLDKTLAGKDLKKIYDGCSYEVKKNIIYVLGDMKSTENIGFLTDCLNTSKKNDLNNEAITALIKIGGKDVIKPLINYLNQFPENKNLIKQMPSLGVKLIEPLFLNLSEKDEKNYLVTKIILEEVVNRDTKDALMEIIKLSVSVIEPVSRLAKEMISDRKWDAVLSAIELFKTADGRLGKEIKLFLSNYSDGNMVADNLQILWKEAKDDDKKIDIIDIISSQKSDVSNNFLLENITDPSEKIRKYIMVKMEPKEYFAEEIFNKLMLTDDKNIRDYYKEALIYFDTVNLNFLLRLFANEKFSYDAEDIMIRLKNKNVDKLLIDNLVLQDKGIDQFRERMRGILTKRAAASIETLIEGLKDKNKINECKKILQMIGKQTIPQLINVLKEDTDDLQTATAAEILLAFGAAAAPELIKELSVDDLWSKMNIAGVLVKLKYKEAIPSLIEVLGSDETALRYRAIYGFRDFGAVAVPELIKNLDSSEENSLTGIIRSLGEIRDKSAVPPLKRKLASVQNEKLKIEIEKALKMLGE